MKHSLARRLKERVGINASDSDHSSSGTETNIEDVKIEVMPATNQHEVFKSAALPDEPQTDISEGEIFSAREGRPKRKAIINRDDIELDEMESGIGKNTGPDMSNLMTSMTPDVELTTAETNEVCVLSAFGRNQSLTFHTSCQKIQTRQLCLLVSSHLRTFWKVRAL